MIKNNSWFCLVHKKEKLEIESEVGIYSCPTCGVIYVNTKFKSIFNTKFKK
jgi:predicted RNA-binding Zn-ribbon protein involved in translation (DUF1610 family)